MSESAAAYKALTAKQRRFVDAYCEFGFNATRAAIEAGYSAKTARSQGSRLLTNVDIAAAVSARLDEAAMPANEVLARLADIARADIGDVLTIQQREVVPVEEEKGAELEERVEEEAGRETEAEPEPEIVEFVTVDLATAKRLGLTRFIKSISWTLHGPRVEIHDPIVALQLIGKHHKLFVERTEVTGKDGGAIELIDPQARLLAAVQRVVDRNAQSQEAA